MSSKEGLLRVAAVATLLLGSSCTLLLARPCDDDAHCAPDQHCDLLSGACAAGRDAGTVVPPFDAGPDGGGLDAGGLDGGPSDAGHLDAGAADAGPDDGGVDGGPQDAGSADDGGGVDAGTQDAGARDGGDVDAGPAPLLPCERYVDVTWSADADGGLAEVDGGGGLGAVAVAVTVPPFGDLVPSGANLRWRTVDGDPLPHWVEDADGASLEVWVRLPSLQAHQRIVAYACDPAAAPGSDGEATFLAFGFVGSGAGWNDTCLTDGDCSSALSAILSPGGGGEEQLLVDVDPGCGGIGSGASGGLLRTVELDVGTYELAGTVGVTGFPNNNIAETGARAILGRDGAIVAQAACMAPYQAGCAAAPAPLAATFEVAAQGSVEIAAVGIANAGCIRAEATFERVRLRRVVDPAPVASFVP